MLKEELSWHTARMAASSQIPQRKFCLPKLTIAWPALCSGFEILQWPFTSSAAAIVVDGQQLSKHIVEQQV